MDYMILDRLQVEALIGKTMLNTYLPFFEKSNAVNLGNRHINSYYNVGFKLRSNKKNIENV